MNRPSYVYIMTNKTHRVLYTGVTSDLVKRVYQHQQGTVPGFTSKYNVRKLVYFETFGDIREAIAREKQIKSWSRQKKVDLVDTSNPEWRDLAEGIGLS